MPAKSITRRLDSMGYVRVTLPDGSRVREHVLLMEQHIGRPLDDHEVVHHRDGNRANNDLSNLELMSRSEHMRMHMTGRSRTGGRWSIHHSACVKCGRDDSPHLGHGTCKRCYSRLARDIARGAPAGLPRKTLEQRGMWSQRFSECVKCGTTEYSHYGRGLCSLCYFRKRQGHSSFRAGNGV